MTCFEEVFIVPLKPISMASQSPQPVAHLLEKSDGSWEVHDLKDHLIHVAEKAAEFADEFGNGDWAKAAGQLHDLGKYNPRWQEYIRRSNGDYSEENNGQD
ncbi:MAG: CRISPR-associated endonuclease Cas3'' [Chlorobium sp.]